MPPLDRHQFGGALGGALVIPGMYDGHNRTFFFADYAGIKERRGVTTVNTVPTAQARLGDFSNYRDRNGNLIVIYDPATTRVDATGKIIRDPFPGNVIPADQINEVGANIASLYPLPNTGSGNFDNYISTPDREITDNAFSGRVDHKISDNDSFFVRFNYGKFKLDAPQGQANCCLPTPPDAAARFDLGPFVAGIQNTRLTTHGAAFNYSKVIKSNLINELRVGYAKTEPFDAIGLRALRGAVARHQRDQRQRHHDGAAEHQHHEFHRHFRRPELPARQPEAVPLSDRGRAGVAARPAPAEVRLPAGRPPPSPFTHTDTRSTIIFGTSFVNDPVTNTGGTGLAEVLLGNFNSASRGFLREPYTLTVIEHGAFIQDDFKLNNRLTVNAGRAVRDLHGAHRRTGSPGELRLRDLSPGIRRRGRHESRLPARRRTTTTSRRGWASRMTSPATRGRSCAPDSGSPTSPIRTPLATCTVSTCRS